ncbi:uncharacterized protein LOC111277525 [Durio zibethinus]|uniref:Uncharacterized protein LOC111277525 n=1 Tax=Durio zibethinus TaxID=66656 RepID=A0A6P5WV28_DURZI|nr:uncharacterized protein LOC111277525 [Durio zibethinus]
MGDMNQEPDFEVPNQEEDDLQLQESINLSGLHLDSFKNNHQNHHPCIICACNVTASNPMKRPSPEPVSEPKSKKPLLDSHQYSLAGFSKIPLPQLHRSASDPYTPPKTNLSENAKALDDTPLSKGSASCSALPPRAPALSRSISDPILSPGKSFSRSSCFNEMGIELIKEESPSVKRLRRMKERMKEMRQWWDEAMREVEDVWNTEAIKGDGEVDCEEAVRVEKIGECLDLDFKCPCGKGYKILLSGKNCYYKLI